MKTAKKPTYLIALGIVGCFSQACGKKSSGSTNDKPSTGGTTATENSQSTASETSQTPNGTNPGNRLAVTGQISLELNLTAPKQKGIVLYTLDHQSKVVGKTLIDVDAEGNFKAEVERNRREKLAKVFENNVVNRELAKEIFPEHKDKLDQASDQEIIDYFSEEIKKMQDNAGLRYVLVSYDKSGDVEAEAASMQFIGLPTANASLKMLPGDNLKGDLALGKIVGEGDEAKSTLTAAESVNLSASVIEELAGASQTLKILKNNWMNPENPADVTPWFGYVTQDLAAAVNAFVVPTKMTTTFGGGGYYIHPYNIGATFGELCPPNPANAGDVSGEEYSATPTKIVSWHPPVELATSSQNSTPFGPDNPYSSESTLYKREPQYKEIQCGKSDENQPGGSLYMRAAKEDATEFQLQLGERLSGPAPVGLWRLKVDNKEVGRWDLAAAVPYDKDSDPVIYVPALKVVTDDSGNATSVEAKFYFYDKAQTQFREVADVAGLKSLLHGFNLDGQFRVKVNGGDLSVGQEQITFGDDGIVRLELVDQYQTRFPCPSDDQSAQCIQKFGFSYHIGAISYRLSLSAEGGL